MLDRRTLAYACIPFSFGLIHCSFYFFYVKVFLNVYKVSEWWFQVSQIMFMVWNTVNDPLIGYLMNNPKWRCSKIRRLPILYGGPIYALTFLLPWFPWGDYKPSDWLCGVHLLVSLCVYDTLFSYIGLTSCCLTTEMTDDYKQRLNMKWYGSLASICAGWSIPFLNTMSDNLTNLRGFQMGAVILALLAHFAMRYCGHNATTLFEEHGKCSDGKVVISSSSCCRPPIAVKTGTEELKEETEESSWTMTKKILSSRDFLSFIATEFLEMFHLTFWSSFTTIFVDNLVPVSSIVKSGFFGFTSLAPSIIYLLIRRPLERFGYYRMYRWNIIMKIFLSIFMWYLGPQPWFFLIFIFLDVVLGDTFARLCDLMMADVTEKLMRQSMRSHPNSSVLVGLNAFMTKPAHSLAPMLIVNLLNRAGYQRYVSDGMKDNVSGLEHLRSVMFAISCAIPFFIGVLQFFAWSFYTIRVHSTTTDVTVRDSEA